MPAPVIVVGHKNPDNDAISAAVGYAYLKNAAAKRDGLDEVYQPVRLGPLPTETSWVLSQNGIEEPELIAHVSPRVRDVMTADPVSIKHDATLLDAGHLLRRRNINALVVTNDDGTFHGLITTRMLAERYISATDKIDDANQGSMNVASDLIDSLSQKAIDYTETDVLKLGADDLLKDAVDELLASDLRSGVVLDDKGFCIGIVTRSDVAAPPKRKVVLVDHNETRQAVSGLEDAEVVEIVDHHRIGDVSTTNPIKFLNLPVGSTATIVTMEFRREGIEIPKEIAAVLLSAIMTDTVILKSPTATAVDKEQVDYLAGIIGMDGTEFGLQVIRSRGGEGDKPIEKIVEADSKEFQVGDTVVLIGQYETVDLPAVLKREAEMREHMNGLIKQNGYDFVLLMVTDIIAEGSQFICQGNRKVINRVFGIECTGEGGTWMPGVLSRKKQVAAPILAG